MTDIKSMTLPELTAFVSSLGEKPFRAKQLYHWMHVSMASSYDEMTNLPAAFREKLKSEAPLTTLKVEDLQVSKLDGTRKYLFRLPDDQLIESVLMRYEHGNAVCISSQVGCRMGCRFCASTLDGLVRGLTPAEMLDQVYRIAVDTGERVDSVVVMGTGEPLDNYESLITFLHLLTDEAGLHLSQRAVTVSTCGIVPRMKELADEDLKITLAVSLHAPTQEERLRLMPVASAYEIHDVVRAAGEYAEKTGRRVTFEYSLVDGVNDRTEDADRLAGLLRGLLCHVNLIAMNPVRERALHEPDQGRIQAFRRELEKKGINVTIRRELGRDIDGACGQLRHRHLAKK